LAPSTAAVTFIAPRSVKTCLWHATTKTGARQQAETAKRVASLALPL
jgi:hypothetical protein